MNKQVYRVLKEIHSLQSQIDTFESEIGAENSRLGKILKMRDERAIELNENSILATDIANKITQIESELEHHTSQLSQSKASHNLVQTQQELKAVEIQIASYEEKIKCLETSYFELNDKLDEVTILIDEANTFLIGSLKSVEEIKAEIAQENHPKFENLSNVTERIQRLMSEIPVNVKTKLEVLLAKNLRYGPFSQIKSNSCSVCGNGISHNEAKEIEQDLKFRSCSGCQRIFMPANVSFL